MRKRQFHILYREFLFRMVDLEALSSHAQGDASKLLGRVASLLIVASLLFSVPALGFGGSPGIRQLMAAWTYQHFLISTTMLAVGLFAVLSWDSTFPDRRDVMVLAPLPVHAGTLFIAKVAAVGTALLLVVGALHAITGLLWPLAFARAGAQSAPALTYQRALPALNAAEFGPVLDPDLAPLLRKGLLQPGVGLAVGVLDRGTRRVFTYGAAKQDSIFEIGSVGKTFTGLMLAQMVEQGRVELREPVRELLPPGTVARPGRNEITLVDLVTHHSGLPRMPDNFNPANRDNPFADYTTDKLYEYLREHGVSRDAKTGFVYSNLGFGLLGQALALRAGVTYPELLRTEITGPLQMNDTFVEPSGEQQTRLLTGYGADHRAMPPLEIPGLLGAGSIRSTARDLLTYLEAQLHPERLPGTLPAAVAFSHRVHPDRSTEARVAFAWLYSAETGAFSHDGATPGFSSYVFFHPKGGYAGVVLLNRAAGDMPWCDLIGEHLRQRFAGEPAFSLDLVRIPPGGGAGGLVRSFGAYWAVMAAAGAFLYCCVLSLQGITAQLLPRAWFLRVSSFLQLACFSVFVSGYFVLKPPQYALIEGARQPLLAWVPTYWFVGLFQQLNGTLHPSMRPLAERAWLGLAAAMAVTAVAYGLSYLRTMRQIVESPDIVPVSRGGAWLPRFGGAFETAVVRFSIRSLLRSRQHRVIFAFYLGIGFALSILLLKAPAAQQLAAESADSGGEAYMTLIAASILMLALAMIGARVTFALPLDLRSNWIFRNAPLHGGPEFLKARRRALIVVALAPVWAIFAVILFVQWPWRAAAGHLALLWLVGLILAEACLGGVHKIPFTCSYLPGKSNLHVSFWAAMFGLSLGILAKGADLERRALQSGLVLGITLAVLAAIWLCARWWNSRTEDEERDDAQFEDAPADEILTLNLSQSASR